MPLNICSKSNENLIHTHTQTNTHTYIYIYIYIYIYTGHWSIVRPDWYSPAPTAPNSRLETDGSPDHRQPCPWVGDPVRAGACLQSGKDSSPVNSATPLAEDGDAVRRPRSESQCRPDCGDCARLVAMARLPGCCWFHSSPVFLPAPSFCKGLLTRLRLLPDCPTRAA